MYWLRAGEVSQVLGVTASPTVFREDGVTVVRGVAPSDEFWDARVDMQLLPSGNFVQRRYNVTGAEVFPADPGYALTNAPYWVFNAGTGVMHSVQIRSLVHLLSGGVTVSVSGHNARLHAFNRSTQTYDLIATSGSPWTQTVTAWRSAYVQPQTDLVDLRLECPDATEGAVAFAYAGSNVQGSAECSASQRYDARRTGVYFKRKGELGYADSLVVGKWENAFEIFLGSVQVRSDFLSRESDTFRIVCMDELKAGTGRITATISTVGAYGNNLQGATSVYLWERQIGSGLFESEDLLAVSDFSDYLFGQTFFPSDYPRLFLTQIGGNLRVECDQIAQVVPIGAGLKTLHVTVVVPMVAGVPITGNIDPAIQVVNERFAQINVRVVVDSVVQSEQPAGVNLLDGLDLGCYTNDITNLTSRVFYLDDEAEKLLDAFSMPNNLDDFRIIFVRDITDVYDFTKNQYVQFSGISFHAAENPKYGNAILINKDEDATAIAHEIGHLLLNSMIDDHSTLPWNLMYNYLTGLGELRNKRLTKQQESDMRTNGGLL